MHPNIPNFTYRLAGREGKFFFIFLFYPFVGVIKMYAKMKAFYYKEDMAKL